MITVKGLKEKLSTYPDDMIVTSEQNEDFIHIINNGDTVIVSTEKPIGYCNRSGGYVYPSLLNGYSAFSPEVDEDLEDWEWTGPVLDVEEK